ncbi:hypothetical protein HAX54_014855, partial [Datura stramonium]|nr:hypothetical protein [Datura stramonium]
MPARPAPRGARPLVLQVVRGSNKKGATGHTACSKANTRPCARRPASQRDKECSKTLSLRDGACNVALDAEESFGNAQGSQNGQTLDFPLQLGKGTLNPPNSSRNKKRINNYKYPFIFMREEVFKQEVFIEEKKIVQYHARATSSARRQAIGATGCARQQQDRHHRPCGTRGKAGTRLGARCPASQHNKVRATAFSPRDGVCNAALDAAAAWGDTQGSQNGQKLDSPLQLGKGTLNPKPNSSRNKKRINLLIDSPFMPWILGFMASNNDKGKEIE